MPENEIPPVKVGGQAVLGRQLSSSTPWLTERHGYDPTSHLCAASSIRAMPENEIPPATRVDIYFGANYSDIVAKCQKNTKKSFENPIEKKREMVYNIKVLSQDTGA